MRREIRKMKTDLMNYGRLDVRVMLFNPERIVNILWNKGIVVENVKRRDIITITMTVKYNDYDEVCKVVKELKGQVEVINRSPFVVWAMKIKNRFSYVIGAVVFICIIYFLSGFVWGVKVEDNKFLSPYEIRKCIYSLGIKPGIRKNKVNVTTLEKDIERANDNVMWVKARIEGSVLKVTVKEKVNPPKLAGNENTDGTIHPIVAKMDGEIVKIYCSAGSAAVQRGDFVKKGDVLIEGVQGKDEYQVEVQPEGTAIAKTFEEKSAEIQVSGNELKRTGEVYKDIYVEIMGRKIYIKKCDKTFKDYDKIENKRKLITEVDYYPKKEVEISESKDNLINKKVDELEKSVQENIERNDKIVDKIINQKDIGSGKIRLNVVFVIERNIAVKE